MIKSFLKKLSGLLCLMVLYSPLAFPQDVTESNVVLSQGQLEELAAPIALYPDPLLAQILPASTYPLEIVQAARLIHSKKDFSKIDAQDWDPSVKAVAHYPAVLKLMNDDLTWSQQLGQAVLNQQDDVLKSIQTLRQRAKNAGNLKSSKQQIVAETETQIEIVPATPEIIYVPVYNPRIVYVTPIVPVVYPLIRFEVGFPIGAWLDFGFYWPSHTIYYCAPSYWGGGWHHEHNISVHNTYVYNNSTTNVTNIYHTNNVVQKNLTQKTWVHDNTHGNPYNGRNIVSAQRQNILQSHSVHEVQAQQKSQNLSHDLVQTGHPRKDMLSHLSSASKTEPEKTTVAKSQNNNLKNFKQGLEHVRPASHAQTPTHSSPENQPQRLSFNSQNNSHSNQSTSQEHHVSSPVHSTTGSNFITHNSSVHASSTGQSPHSSNAIHQKHGH